MGISHRAADLGFSKVRAIEQWGHHPPRSRWGPQKGCTLRRDGHFPGLWWRRIKPPRRAVNIMVIVTLADTTENLRRVNLDLMWIISLMFAIAL